MIGKIELGPKSERVFGNPAPLGLLGLAIASLALVPISFGYGVNAQGFATAAIYAALFGAGCQLLAGIMDFANKNNFGGAIFTTFAFMWAKNAWVLHGFSQGKVADHSIEFFVDAVLFVVFVILTYGFGFFGRNLFLFLLDIDLLYAAKIVNGITHSQMMAIPIGILTLLLALISLWITFQSLINPVAGKDIFFDGPPLFKSSRKKPLFDFTLRFNIFNELYLNWKERAFHPMAVEDLEKRIREKIGEVNIIPDIFYLMDYGCLVVNFSDEANTQVKDLRLNARGIDIYEQLILKKYDF